MGESDERYVRDSSPQTGRRLRGGKMTGRNETGPNMGPNYSVLEYIF